MKNYLVPLDGSEGAQRALHYACERAKDAGACVHLLHVEPPPRGEALHAYGSNKDYHRLRHQPGRSLLDQAVEQLKKDDVLHETHMREGDAAHTIARFVEAQKIDEVIMGTRGMGALGQMLLGSVAQRVLQAVRVPVTLVK